MIVSELFTQLSLSELSNLSLANDGAGTIKEASKGKIILLANDAMRRLYTRYILTEKTLILSLKANITDYLLQTQHAVSAIAPENTAEAYIEDTAEEPFLGDVVRVLDVYDSLGNQYTLNDAGNPLSLFTPKGNLLQVPHPDPARSMAVVYQAFPVKLTGSETQTIELPALLEPALRAYIAHSLYNGMNTAEAVAASQRFLGRYEDICQEAESKDLLSANRSSAQTTKFQNNGWV